MEFLAVKWYGMRWDSCDNPTEKFQEFQRDQVWYKSSEFILQAGCHILSLGHSFLVLSCSVKLTSGFRSVLGTVGELIKCT